MQMQVGGYDRKIIFKNEVIGFQIVRIKWPPMTQTEMHDHNGHGLIFVRRGRLFERRDTGKVRHYVGGAFATESAITTRHVMGNSSKTEWAESWHLYPDDMVMTTYPDNNVENLEVACSGRV